MMMMMIVVDGRWYQIIQSESQRIAEVRSVTSTRALNSACFHLVTHLIPRDYPDPDNPRHKKELVVKLCASLL